MGRFRVLICLEKIHAHQLRIPKIRPNIPLEFVLKAETLALFVVMDIPVFMLICIRDVKRIETT